MKICVCVKPVEETYARTGLDPERQFISPKDRIIRINPYDEIAMALAVRAAKGAANPEIIVLTLGPIIAEAELWRLMAMGGDRLCQVDPGPLEGGVATLDSWSKAQLLAQAITAMGADLVLCGNASIDRQNGLLPAYLAHRLKRPFVSAILDVGLTKGATRARVVKSAGKGRREVIDSRLPAVFSVELTSAVPPSPPFTERDRVRREGITRMLVDAGAIEARTTCLRTEPPCPRPVAAAAPESTLPAFDRMRQLLTGSTIQKSGRLITGTPESQVDEIVGLLEAEGIAPIKTGDRHQGPS